MNNLRKIVFIVLVSAADARAAFVVSPSYSSTSIGSCTFKPTILKTPSSITLKYFQSTTNLHLGYKLPNSPRGPLDDLKDIIPTIATGAMVVLFFATPFGAAFFAIFNSLFILSILTPFILFLGYQAWSALYTYEAPCPSCERIPIRALKNGQPTVCLNCGAFVRVNQNENGLELCNNPNDIMNDETTVGSIFDSLFGMEGNDASEFGTLDSNTVLRNGRWTNQSEKSKRQNTIIDVEVERDE